MPESSEKRKILIVGGVAGGASAATRCRRLSEQDEIVLFERNRHISFANCGLPYHIGETISDREKLILVTPDRMKALYNIDVRVQQEVVSIDRAAKTVKVRRTETGETYEESYDRLILSPGAKAIVPPLPGAELPRVRCLRNIPDMDAIKAIVDGDKPHRAVVVGGGYIGLEMAEALRERGVAVALVERLPQVMSPVDAEMAAPLHDELIKHGVQLYLEASVESIAEKNASEMVVSLSTGERLRCGLVLMAVGVTPESDLAREAGLELGEKGGIRVNAHMQTSDPDIYAIGDAVEFPEFVTEQPVTIPLAGPAARQGRVAADHIHGRPSAYKKTQATAVCKVFEMTVAATGPSEKMLRQAGRPYRKLYIHPTDHVTYYPGASRMQIKLLFDPGDGRVLGAQAVGSAGVDKRIDVLATALRGGMTVYDLEELELCYAPPYGAAKDPINFAGFVAANSLRGDVLLRYDEEILAEPGKYHVLDVRPPEMFAKGTISQAVNLPVTQLRERLGELPRDKEIAVHCNVGLNSYIASRILTQNGFRASVISGGQLTHAANCARWPHPKDQSDWWEPDEE